MNSGDVPHIRLHNLQISRTALTTPAEMVRRLGAVQSQDYAGAKWSLGMRLRPTTDTVIDTAFNDGYILRTHVLRPTWHFVMPDDIRWLLALTAPRVHQVNAGMYRRVGMDSATLKHSIDAIIKLLEGGRQLTRDELRDALTKVGIPAEGVQRMAYILMNAELEAVVCSGPRRGKQFTYMLLDERAPNAPAMARDEALGELTRRYFLSRGPATEYDFAKWSGLTVADARRGIEAAESQLQRENVDGTTYWLPPALPSARDPSPTAYLLSIYDEYISSYKDYRAIRDDETGVRLVAMGNALQNVIVLDGRIVGTWRRTLRKDAAEIEMNSLVFLTDVAKRAIAVAAEQYGEFLGRWVEMTIKKG
jgi:hypothetical protein